MHKKALLILAAVIVMGVTLLFVDFEHEAFPQYLTMTWGIPEEVTAFENLPREPQGEKIEMVEEGVLQVKWQVGGSYVLPISSTSDQAVEGVRYLGSGIPDHLGVEWIDPREKTWYPIDQIPEDKVKVIIDDENGYHTVDFGPPEGADFGEDTTRLIWFRITPTEAENFEFEIFGYQAEEDDHNLVRVSNVLTLQAEIEQ